MSTPKSARARKGMTPDGVIDLTGDVKLPKRFHIAPDNFDAIPDAPGGMFLDLAGVSEAKTRTEQIAAVETFFSQVLTDESFALYQKRLRDKNNPISLPQALRAFEWLVEQYSGDLDRPTMDPSTSQDGSNTTGQSSTGPALSKGLTPSEVG